jgi:AraC family transcriptional regulator
MTSDVTLPTLTTGQFFGNSCREVITPSFRFAELVATVPEREVPRHTHDAPHFILVTEGIYVTAARNHKGLCSDGTLIFNPAGTTHRDCFRSTEGKFVSVSMGADAANLFESAGSVPVVVGSSSPSSLDGDVGDRILDEVRNSLSLRTPVLEGLGFELIALVSLTPERTTSRTLRGWLLQAREMIHDCADLGLTIAELADSAGVHPVYLARAYRRHFGCSPGESLRSIRLRRVRELLGGTNLPLVEIALQCGFSDQSQMTRAFSKIFRTSPARYRELRRRCLPDRLIE